MKKIYSLFIAIIPFISTELLAQSIYLKLDNVSGSSNYAGFAGWSQISSFTHKIETPNLPRQGGPLSANAFDNRPGMVTLTMLGDIISPTLLEASASGIPIKAVTIVHTRGSDNNRFEVKLTLKNVVVQAVDTDIRLNSLIRNQVTLTYAGFLYEYLVPSARGGNSRFQSEDFSEVEFRKN